MRFPTIFFLLLMALAGSLPGFSAIPAADARCCVLPDKPVAPPTQTLEEAFMGLSSGPLRSARVEGLPKGLLLRTVEVEMTEAQLNAELQKAKSEWQAHAFVFFEQTAVRTLLVAEASAWAATAKRDTTWESDRALLQTYLQSLTATITVTREELRVFYTKNAEEFGGAAFERVEKELHAYLLEEKRQGAISRHINTISDRTHIEVDRAWVEAQAAIMFTAPVDTLRRSGKPLLVEFGASGCYACDQMAPIINELEDTYRDRCHVLYVDVRKNQALALRYGIHGIPVQVFYDKEGKEVYRHTGFFAKSAILAQLEKMWVK